jgi:hypothetical protein
MFTFPWVEELPAVVVAPSELDGAGVVDCVSVLEAPVVEVSDALDPVSVTVVPTVEVSEAVVSDGEDVVVSVSDSCGAVEVSVDCVSVLDGPGVVDCVSVADAVEVSATVVVSEVSCNSPSTALVGTVVVVTGSVATTSDVVSGPLEDVCSVPTASDVVVSVSETLVVVGSSITALPLAQSRMQKKATNTKM